MKKHFKIIEYGTRRRTELLAGITTFLTAMYIIVVNPQILSNPLIGEIFPDSPMTFNAVLTATVLVSAFSSIAMGVYANNPILVAPGMGLNAFFTYSVVVGDKVHPTVALGAVFLSGVLFFFLSIFKIRVAIVHAIPQQLRYGVAAGIGLFIAFIGFQNSGFIIGNPATLVQLAPLNGPVLVFVLGMIVLTALVLKRVPGAMVLGILFTTVLAAMYGRVWGAGAVLVEWNGFMSSPDFSLIGKLDIIGALQLSMIPIIFAFFFTDLFDSLSTFVGVAEAADLIEDGQPRNVHRALIADAFATLIAGVFGTSSGTSYVESAAGVEQGGRTGLTAVVAGILFLPFLFLSPLVEIVPSQATAPVLVVVGVFMMRPAGKINWSSFEEALPAFLALLLIPLTYSITQGIVWGFLAYTFVKIVAGKFQELPRMIFVIDLFAVIALFAH